MKNIVDVENRTGVNFAKNVIDINYGRLKLNGKAYDVVAVLCDCLFSADDIKKLSACKKVVHVGTANYRYAPEIERSVVYIKA